MSHHCATVRSGSQFSSSHALTSARTSSAVGIAVATITSSFVGKRTIDESVPFALLDHPTARAPEVRMARPMTHDEWQAFVLDGTRTGKVAVARKDGMPHVVPVWFVLDGDDFIFTTGEHAVKA